MAGLNSETGVVRLGGGVIDGPAIAFAGTLRCTIATSSSSSEPSNASSLGRTSSLSYVMSWRGRFLVDLSNRRQGSRARTASFARFKLAPLASLHE